MRIRKFFSLYAVLLALPLYFGVVSIGSQHPLLVAILFTVFGFNLRTVVGAIIFLRDRSWLMRP